jgi:hypothetical protein
LLICVICIVNGNFTETLALPFLSKILALAGLQSLTVVIAVLVFLARLEINKAG